VAEASGPGGKRNYINGRGLFQAVRWGSREHSSLVLNCNRHFCTESPPGEAR